MGGVHRDRDPMELAPIGVDTFASASLSWFRVRFERDDGGTVTNPVGDLPRVLPCGQQLRRRLSTADARVGSGGVQGGQGAT